MRLVYQTAIDFVLHTVQSDLSLNNILLDYD